MNNIKTKPTGISSFVETKSLNSIEGKTGNIYESIVVVSKRASQIAVKTKEELHSKLSDFASTSDNLEEVHENREQIEISKHYEKMPNPTLQATQEFLEDKVYFRNPAKEPLV